MITKDNILFYVSSGEAKAILKHIAITDYNDEAKTFISKHFGYEEKFFEKEISGYSQEYPLISKVKDPRDKLSEIPEKVLDNLIGAKAGISLDPDNRFNSAIMFLWSKSVASKHLSEEIEILEEVFADVEGEITLEGYFLTVSQPSEARLRQYRTNYYKGISESLDRNVSSTEGFSFFDNSLLNKFKTLRRKCYNLIDELSIKLQKVENNTLYLLPTVNVVDFVEGIDEINTEYSELKERILVDFELLKENNDLEKFLDERGMRLKKPPTTDMKIRYSFHEVSINVNTLKTAVGSAMGKELDSRARSLLAKYEDEVVDRQRKILVELEHDLTSDLSQLLKTVANALTSLSSHTHKVSVALERNIKEMVDKSRITGLRKLQDLAEITYNSVKAQRSRSYKDLEKFTKNLCSRVSVPQPKLKDLESETDRARELNSTLVQATAKLSGQCDSRVLALKRKMAQMNANGGGY